MVCWVSSSTRAAANALRRFGSASATVGATAWAAAARAACRGFLAVLAGGWVDFFVAMLALPFLGAGAGTATFAAPIRSRQLPRGPDNLKSIPPLFLQILGSGNRQACAAASLPSGDVASAKPTDRRW